MKIITWNCNMAFRKKADSILKHNPDILIIQECEHPDKLIFPSQTPKPVDTLWFGENKHKGLAVFSYSHYRFSIHESHNQDFRMVIPILVTGGEIDFYLFAIWANNPKDRDGQYVTQVWKAINYYNELLTHNPSLLLGDFNSNSIWDRKKRIGNHSCVVNFLADKSIHSTYHLHHKQIQGKEEHPTLFLYHHGNKPYHLDYCFASESFLEKLHSVEIGEFDFWSRQSDHVPLIVTFINP